MVLKGQFPYKLYSSLERKKLASYSLAHVCLDENTTDLEIPHARELLSRLAEKLNSFHFGARCFALSLIS